MAEVVYDKIQDAPNEIKAWREEVEGLQVLVERIKDAPALQQQESLKPIVEQCKDAVNALVTVFDGIDFAKTDALGRRTWKAIGGLLKEAELVKLFGRIERLKSTLNTEIALATLNQGEGTLREVKRYFQPGSEEEKCLQSLFVTDPVSDREGIITAKGHRTPDTCEWIVRTEEYQSWETSQSSLLWISGPPGKGKTYISIFLTQLLETSKPDATVISFFCNNQVATRNTSTNILRGLMTQLCARHEHLISCIMPTWRVQNDNLFKDGAFETLWRIFISMLGALEGNDAICILDALDECSEPSLSPLVFKLKALFNGNGTRPACQNLKLILLSREQPQCLPEAFSGFPRVKIDDAKRDVELYIIDKVAELVNDKGIEKRLCDHIKKVFQEQSEGTFLWVSLMVEELKQKTVDEIEAALDKLPRGLEAVYEQILSKISTNKKQHIAEMLTWITLAEYPLEVRTICEAMQIKPTNNLNSEQVCMEYIRSCKNILQLSSPETIQDGEEPTISLVHQSVKDFLLKPPSNQTSGEFFINQIQGHQIISNRLIHHLSSLFKGKYHETIPSYDDLFSQYAIHHWDYHMREIGDKFMAVVEENNRFFCKKSIVRNNWWKCIRYEQDSDRDVPLLHIACSTGLLHLAKWILLRRNTLFGLSRKREVNRIWGELKMIPLHYAVQINHTSIVHLLLEYGADASCGDQYGETPLHSALSAQAPDIFHSLLMTPGGNKIAKREAKHPRGRDALLHLAAKHGKEEICLSLVENYNHDINAQDIMDRTPLHEAIRAGHINLAKTLVSRLDAKVISQKQLLRNVFIHYRYKRVQQNFQSTLEFVIHDLKLNINAVDNGGNTVLHDGVASWAGLSQALALGADLKLRNQNGETVMHCQPDHSFSLPELLFVLDQCSIDINVRDDRGRTPLHAYSYKSLHMVWIPEQTQQMLKSNVLKLLDLGADRSLRDMMDDTPSSALVKSLEKALESIADYFTKEIAAEKMRQVGNLFAELMDILENYETVPVDPAATPPTMSQLSEWNAEVFN